MDGPEWQGKKGTPEADDQTGDYWFAAIPTGRKPVEINIGMAHIARVYDYWLGGEDDDAAGTKAAEEVIAAFPGIGVSTDDTISRAASSATTAMRGIGAAGHPSRQGAAPV